MRYECQEPGFEGAFLEFSDRGWTRKDIALLRQLDESDAWFALLHSKLVGLYLPTVEGGEPNGIRHPAELTAGALDWLDLVLYNWFVTALVEALRDVNSLGNAPWRRLSRAQEAAAATNSPTQP
jgi:hypothetical protein